MVAEWKLREQFGFLHSAGIVQSLQKTNKQIEQKTNLNPLQNCYFHSFICYFTPFFGLFLSCFGVFFYPARMRVQQITKHRLHWLLGLIERKASLVRSASACLCRNGHLTSSGKGAKNPLCRQLLNSALNHTLWRLRSDEVTEQTEDVGKKKRKKKALRETTGEITHQDGWKFSRAIDALLRLAGTRSKGPWNTCREGSGKRAKPPPLLPPPLSHCAECIGTSILGILQAAITGLLNVRQWHVWLNIWAGFRRSILK